MDQEEKFFKKHGIRILLALLVVFGVLLSELFGPQGRWTFGFAEHLGMAMAVSGVIGLVIEFTLQRQIVKNVFDTAIGYLLPESLRGELRWIYGLEVVCERHVETVNLERIEGTDLVRLRVLMTRTLRNISDRDIPKFEPSLGIDEWFCPEHSSRITNCVYQLDGEDCSANFANEQYLEKSAHGIAVKPPPVLLRSGKRITTSFEYEEIKQENDAHFHDFASATTNVSITLYWPEGFTAQVDFSHREKHQTVFKKGDRLWQMDGVLLPHQDMRIRWRRNDQSKAWMEGQTA